MKAMIFAAGLGTRLKPLTDNKPKALVEVKNTPLLEIVITKLKKSGFDEIYLWGVEWWWWLGQKTGDWSYWEYGKQMNNE